MDTKKFDVIGIGHPCVDYLAHIDSLPASNESRSVLNGQLAVRWENSHRACCSCPLWAVLRFDRSDGRRFIWPVLL